MSSFWPLDGGRPWTDENSVSFMPRAFAFSFMRSTKLPLDPATCSLMAWAASFADAISSAFIISSRVKDSPSLR